jgi:hypothetical protein
MSEFLIVHFKRIKICGESGSILSSLFTVLVVAILLVLRCRERQREESVLPLTKKKLEPVAKRTQASS